MNYPKRVRRMPNAPRRHIRTASRFPDAGKSLAKRRRWYADDDTDADNPEPGATDDMGGSDDDADDVPELLKQLRAGQLTPEQQYAMITGLREEAAGGRQAKKDLAKFQKAQEDERQRDAQAKGEFEKLWNEAQPKLKRLEELEAQHEARLETVKERNEARLKELPKDKQAIARGIIQKAGTVDPDTVSAILDDLLPSLSETPKPPPGDGGAKGDSRKQAASAKVKLNKASF